MAPRMLRYCGSIWEYTVAQNMDTPLIKQILIVLYEKDKNMKHTLRNEWDDKGKLIYKYHVIHAWEMDRDTIIQEGLVGLYPLMAVMKAKNNETVEDLMAAATAAIGSIEDKAMRCEVLAVFSILGSGLHSESLIKKYVRSEDVMDSAVFQEWAGVFSEEAVKKATLLATVNTTRKKTIDALVVRFKRIPNRIKNRLQFIDRLELLSQLFEKAILVSSIDEFEEELNQAEKEQDTLVH